MKMKNKHLDNIREEERKKHLRYKITVWTLVLLATGATALAIAYIIQHPNY